MPEVYAQMVTDYKKLKPKILLDDYVASAEKTLPEEDAACLNDWIDEELTMYAAG